MARTVFDTLPRASFALGCLFVLAGGACSDLIGPGEKAQDQILFLSSRGGATTVNGPLMDIYRMNADGSGVVNLTNDPASYSSLEVTPDGRTVIFGSSKSGTPSSGSCSSATWTMAPDGSGLKRVDCHGGPYLSPDGTRYARQSSDDIYVANIDGSGSRLVTQSVPPVVSSCTGASPKYHVRLVGWLTVTRPMFYRHVCGQGYTYFSVNADGSGLDTLDFDVDRAYLSPDFKRIAFHGPNGASVMDVDGRNVRLVAAASLPSRFPVRRSPWSPDGTRLYLNNALSNAHYVADLNAGVVRQLPTPPGKSAVFNGWSPSGDRIAFTTYTVTSEAPLTYALDIYGMNADGTGGVNLTNGTFWNQHALWVRGR